MHKLPLLDPRNDYVFKKLFTTALPLLSDLINAVRAHEPAVMVLKVLNPRIDAKELHGKYIILDILAKDSHGSLINIEMQVSRQERWSARSMYYLAKTLSGQLKVGEKYAAIKPVIGIHLLDFELFEEKEQALWCFEMRDRLNPSIRLGSELQLNVVELPKADRLARASHGSQVPGTIAASLMAWVLYFKHSNEEHIMNQLAYPPVLEAMALLEALSEDEEARRLADVRERALIAERTEIEAAEERGEARGEVRGEARGIQLANERALRSLIQSGMSEVQARAILNL